MTGGAWPEQPSPRFILSRLLRRDELCPGAFDCPEARYLDPLPGRDALPCSECPRERLDLHMRLSEAGRLLAGALELDWAVRCGLQVRWDEVSYPDFVRLRILQEERHKKEVEDIERDRDQQERDRKWAQRRGK